jgi:hypothetical protein
MEYTAVDLKLESCSGFLAARLTGDISLPESVDITKTVCNAAIELEMRNILFDCTDVRGELSVTQRFVLAKTFVDYCEIRSIPLKVALIGKPPTITGLAAKVARNRGMMIEVFADRQAGLEWLKGTSSKATAT